MSLSITIELSEADLQHFQDIVRRAHESAGQKSRDEIIAAASKLVEEGHGKEVPEFIAQRLAKLESLISMVKDDLWAMGPEDCSRVLTALAYFADPKDVIPDTVPVVGLLDDAIMIELCVRELKHEIDAYEDFVSFRTHEAQGRGIDPAKLARAEWLEERRVELQERMRRRRTGGYAGYSGLSVFRVG